MTASFYMTTSQVQIMPAWNDPYMAIEGHRTRNGDQYAIQTMH